MKSRDRTRRSERYILELLVNRALIRIAAVPDLGFPEETQASALNHLRLRQHMIRSEEDRCAEDAFEGRNQAPILSAAFVQRERLEHLACAPEADRLALLLNGKRRQIDQNEPVLSPRQPEARMAGDLQDEVAVPPFIEQIGRSGLLDRQSTQYEWPRTESQVLVALLSPEPDLAAGLSHPKLTLRDDQFRRHRFQNGTGARH